VISYTPAMKVLSSLVEKICDRQAPCLLVGFRMEHGDIIVVDLLNVVEGDGGTKLYPGTIYIPYPFNDTSRLRSQNVYCNAPCIRYIYTHTH